MPFPEQFYKDLQGKDSKNDEHSGELGKFYINVCLVNSKLILYKIIPNHTLKQWNVSSVLPIKLLGLIPKFPRISVGKRHSLVLESENNATKKATRTKRMVDVSPHPHPNFEHHCHMESVIGVERKGLPFTCKARQIPLLVMVGIMGFISSCILGCCFRKCLKAICCCCCSCPSSGSQNPKKIENNQPPQQSPNRDVVMIKI